MTLDSEQQAIEESWTPVKNLKKERYEDRKRRDAQEQAEIAQAEAQSREDSIPSQNDGDFTEVNAEVDAWSTPNVAKQSFPQQTSKSRKKGNKSTKKEDYQSNQRGRLGHTPQGPHFERVQTRYADRGAWGKNARTHWVVLE
eukprot:1006164_1